MAAYFKIDKDRRLVMSTAVGVFTLNDGLAHQEKLLKHPDFSPNFSQLLDFLHVTKMEITPAGVRKLAERSIFSPNSRRSVLVGGDLAFGLARMFLIFRETQGEKGVRIFRNLEDALCWVLADYATI
jgi:hypothetical protein